MPYIEQAHMAHPDIGHMNPEQLHLLADRVLHDSGALHHLPHGHTADTVRDMVKILLLSAADDMAAVETWAPLAPLALGLGLAGPWGWGWPYYSWGGPWFGRRPFRRGFRGGHHHGGGHRGRR